MSLLEKIPQPAEVELGMPLLQDPTVAGIGEAALIGVYPEKIKGRLTGRWHEQHTIDLDGHRHAVLVTNPQAQYSQTDAYFFGGFSQTVCEPGGPGYTVHTELAARWPHIRMVSVEATGIGRFGDRIHHNTRELATMEAMAEQRLRLLMATGGDRQKILVTLSMGTVIGTHMLELALLSGHDLGVIADIKYVPAVVTPENIEESMKKRFPMHVVKDSGREMVDRRNLLDPRNLINGLRVMGHSGLSLADGPALVVQAGSLYKGIELPRVKHDTQNYRVAIIGGGRDPLTQPEMWTREQEENPHNVDLKIIPDRGHGMAVDSVGAAVQVDRTLQRIGVAA